MVEGGSLFRWFLRILGWTVAAAIAVSAGLSITSDYLYRYHSDDIQGPARNFHNLDNFFSAVADGHGIFLHLTGFQNHKILAMMTYMRAVYRLYPLPVLTAEPGVRIITLDELLDNNPDRDGTWMIDHGVQREISLEFNESGEFSFRVIPAHPGG
jgi:hypothetical protein